ncbi:MAG TPA: hypothetical protein PK018_06770 [Candidatus Competibacter sp.]|nr:hypothetical protein [Candidatus Competibacteraceae bacterium]HPE71859.1 hypothetical protein [Candidatus Competibacter sp.]HRX71109.1 hypothetical protein [Candidatus Competibacteraceae bacterium]
MICVGPDWHAHLFRSHRPLFYLVRRGVTEDTLDQALKRQALAAGLQRLPGEGILTGDPHRGDVIASDYLFATDMAD